VRNDVRRLFSRVALSVSILAFIATLFIVTAPAGHSPAAARSAAVSPDGSPAPANDDHDPAGADDDHGPEAGA
jgi:hypothetical protein